MAVSLNCGEIQGQNKNKMSRKFSFYAPDCSTRNPGAERTRQGVKTAQKRSLFGCIALLKLNLVLFRATASSSM